MGVCAVHCHIRRVRCPAVAGLPAVEAAAAFLGGSVFRWFCSQQHPVVHRSDRLPDANRPVHCENRARCHRRAVVAVWADLGGGLTMLVMEFLWGLLTMANLVVAKLLLCFWRLSRDRMILFLDASIEPLAGNWLALDIKRK